MEKNTNLQFTIALQFLNFAGNLVKVYIEFDLNLKKSQTNCSKQNSQLKLRWNEKLEELTKIKNIKIWFICGNEVLTI